ncbi:hypothetical protein LWF01_13050 [Saxibacter everestensis]|uniref:SalK n=1 Tax=Saxibacter everestensis TaxID=2909229 RepID=A0ABY8QPX6_9MICO|nr:hypothetical protein LWF01_13050 [Brevibacteriaceae bacterium ZFBP1038]
MDNNVAGRSLQAIEALHSCAYFAPETEEALVAAGLRPGRMCYFASRAAPMGEVTAPVVTATFFNFSPGLVARHIPRAWSLAPAQSLIQPRLEAAGRALRRLLGDEAADSADVARAADLAREATDHCRIEGRPLFAGHTALAWPDEPLLVLWHAITLMREHRGDGHIAALVGTGLSGIEALVSHTATNKGFTIPAAIKSRGWSEEDWTAAVQRLAERGVLTPEGELTDAGRQLRIEVETATDAAAIAPWRALGAEKADELVTLGGALARAAVNARAFPAGTFAAGSNRNPD